jgi:hypothetical protein
LRARELERPVVAIWSGFFDRRDADQTVNNFDGSGVCAVGEEPRSREGNVPAVGTSLTW